MAVLITAPWLALIPAAVFLLAYRRYRIRPALVAGAAWLLYAPYEYAMLHRWLCSGECNIRVDLLAIYPALGIISVAAAVALSTAWRRRHRVRG